MWWKGFGRCPNRGGAILQGPTGFVTAGRAPRQVHGYLRFLRFRPESQAGRRAGRCHGRLAGQGRASLLGRIGRIPLSPSLFLGVCSSAIHSHWRERLAWPE